MTQMINRSTALSGFILLMEPRQIKRPHGIAPTRVIPNSSKVTRNPFDNAANTSANIYSSFCNNYSTIETALSYFSDIAFSVPSAFH